MTMGGAPFRRALRGSCESILPPAKRRHGVTPPFPLTAKVKKLTIKADRPQLSPADIQKLKTAMQQKAQSE